MAMTDKGRVSTWFSTISSKDKEKLNNFIRLLPYKIQHYSSYTDGKKFYVDYVPPELEEIDPPPLLDLD